MISRSPIVSQEPERPALRDPYTVERYPSLNGSVHIVGYDSNGDVMVELRLPAGRVTTRTLERLQQWMRANDGPPPTPLSLVE